MTICDRNEPALKTRDAGKTVFQSLPCAKRLNEIKVVNPRAALLSNYEVLAMLKERDHEQKVHARAALVKKEDIDDKLPPVDMTSIVSQNVRTVQYEVLGMARHKGCWLTLTLRKAIAHLSTSPLLTTRQDKETIVKLMTGLKPFSLTKLEKLQIVNLLPRSLVELYVVSPAIVSRWRPCRHPYRSLSRNWKNGFPKRTCIA